MGDKQDDKKNSKPEEIQYAYASTSDTNLPELKVTGSANRKVHYADMEHRSIFFDLPSPLCLVAGIFILFLPELKCESFWDVRNIIRLFGFVVAIYAAKVMYRQCTSEPLRVAGKYYRQIELK